MKYFILFSLLICLLTSCKPTEKGYKNAYDAALGKREAAYKDIDVDLPEGALQEVDGPQLKEVDGKKVYILNQRIRPVDDSQQLPGSYNVVVGSYKMITNSRSQSEALKEEGYAAFPVKNGEGNFYTVAGSFEKLDEAVSLYENYKKEKDRVYVGLPNSPVIIYSPR